MERKTGTISRGIRCPIFREGDDIAQLVTDSVLEAAEYEVSAGGGMVKLVMDGKHKVKSMEIDPDIVDPDDIEMLQDLIVAAANEALRQMEAANAEVMNSLTGGLGGGFPF